MRLNSLPLLHVPFALAAVLSVSADAQTPTIGSVEQSCGWEFDILPNGGELHSAKVKPGLFDDWQLDVSAKEATRIAAASSAAGSTLGADPETSSSSPGTRSSPRLPWTFTRARSRAFGLTPSSITRRSAANSQGGTRSCPCRWRTATTSSRATLARTLSAGRGRPRRRAAPELPSGSRRAACARAGCTRARPAGPPLLAGWPSAAWRSRDLHGTVT